MGTMAFVEQGPYRRPPILQPRGGVGCNRLSVGDFGGMPLADSGSPWNEGWSPGNQNKGSRSDHPGRGAVGPPAEPPARSTTRPPPRSTGPTANRISLVPLSITHVAFCAGRGREKLLRGAATSAVYLGSCPTLGAPVRAVLCTVGSAPSVRLSPPARERLRTLVAQGGTNWPRTGPVHRSLAEAARARPQRHPDPSRWLQVMPRLCAPASWRW